MVGKGTRRERRKRGLRREGRSRWRGRGPRGSGEHLSRAQNEAQNICKGAVTLEREAPGLTAGGRYRDFSPGLEVQGPLFD